MEVQAMKRSLARWEPQVYAVLRIMAGTMFALHGTAKLFGWPGDKAPAAAHLLIAAGVIESFTGFMIALGFQTRWAALLASGTMAVAYFKSHAFGGSFFPTVNRGELAVLYCFLFLFIAARGSGIWSADGREG